MKDIEVRLLLLDEDQMLRWRSNFSSVLNHHIPEDVPSGHQLQIRTNTRISTAADRIADIIDAIKALPS